MTYTSLFLEHASFLVSNLEARLLVAIIFPALVLGIAIKFMRKF